MSGTQCVVCGREMGDTAYACIADAQSLTETLMIASGHAEDAETVIARQARYGGGGRGGNGEPLPVDLTASAKYAAIGTTITTWARHALEEQNIDMPAWQPAAGPPCPAGWCQHDSCRTIRTGRPASPIGLAAGWLATQTGWLRKRPEAREAFTDLEAACHGLARLVDRPADKELVGMCDCGKVLYAPRGRATVTCPEATCKLTWNVERSRDILRRALDGRLVTAAEAAHFGAYLDTDRNQQQIRKLINAWSARGQLVPHGWLEPDPDEQVPEGEEPKKRPTFLFGEVAARLARAPRRTAARAAGDERLSA